MKLMLRRILRGSIPLLLLTIVIGGIGMLGKTQVAKACWNPVLVECFNHVQPTIMWPWEDPVGSGRRWRRWRIYPPYQNWPTWGFSVGQYYDTHMCQEDQTSLWCIGAPPTNDPRYSVYPPNLDTYMTYGPINLSTAVAAGMSFWLYCESEQIHDTVFWGAATTYDLPPASPQLMNVAEVFSGDMNSQWQNRQMDFANLRNAVSGDSVSMLGQSTVYVFWRFRADGNQNPPALHNIGAFVDNVTISWDDGGVNLEAFGVTLLKLADGDTVLQTNPQIGDTCLAYWRWGACDGGIGAYPPFRIIGLADDQVIYDTVYSDCYEGTQEIVYSNTWVLSSADSHFVRFSLDTLNEVGEVDETDNIGQWGYYVEPPNPLPTFTWLNPSTDTVLVGNEVWLRWFCSDPDEVASLRIFTDVDQIGCQGILLGTRQENDGIDSLRWDLSSRPEGYLAYPFARVTDAANDTCIYAPFPVLKVPSGTGGQNAGMIPEKLFLEQNYPNPFNPATELRYGLARGGLVTLKVYDVLGRQVAELVNGMQEPGIYTVVFDGRAFSTGLYLYTLTTPEGTESRKMMLMK